MSDFKNNTKIDKSSDRSFGIVFSIFFIFLFSYFLFFKNIFLYQLIIVSSLFFILSFISPKIFKYPNLVWIKIGIVIGNIIAPLVMGLIFIFIFLPTGILCKIFGVNLLDMKNKDNKRTFWKKRVTPLNSMFRQY